VSEAGRPDLIERAEDSPLTDGPPARLGPALRALARCVARTAVLVATHRVAQPKGHVGEVLHFADGSKARVYRETVARRAKTEAPAVLVVEFRLRWIRGRGHAAFRAESLLNTPLFVGFPGFVSKLWLAHDENGAYRGLYEWDGPALAQSYVAALWWVLALVSVRGSIHSTVVPGLRRDQLLHEPSALGASGGSGLGDWWRLTALETAPGET
jgi:hypothetical protein